MVTELQLEAFREWFTGKYTYSAEYFQLAHFDIERGFFTANDMRDPSAVDAAWVLRASFDAWQHQQADVDSLQRELSTTKQVLNNVIDMERAKKDKLQKRVDVVSESIDSFFDNQVRTPTQREYCNFIAEIKQALRGEHD